ncbi:MFS transporter [Bordetella pertussis]
MPPQTISRSMPGWLILMGALTAIGPFSIDMYLPAFPSIAAGLGVERGEVERTLAAYLIGMAGAQIIYGPLADRYGRKPIVMAFGLGVALAVFPVAHIVTAQPWTLFVAQLIGLLVWALLAAIFPAFIAEQVPTQARAMGVGFISSLSVAIFGGTAPYINAWLGAHDLGWVYTAYVAALGVMAFIGAFLIRETAGLDLNDIPLPGEPDNAAVSRRAAYN